MALAYLVGILAGSRVGWAPVALAGFAWSVLPIPLWTRPAPRIALAVVLVAGALSDAASVRSREDGCVHHISAGHLGTVTGRFLAPPGRGGGSFLLEATSEGADCRTVVRARLREGGAPLGVQVVGRGWWSPEPTGTGRGAHAGRLTLDAVSLAPATEEGDGWRGTLARARGRALARIQVQFGSAAPVVEALILARKERLDPEIRDAYARSGVAHLLAISGFHVGVLATLAAGIVRLLRCGPIARTVIPCVLVWAYVAVIGAPPAAVRAAAILSVLVASRLRGRPTFRPAGLSVVLLGFLCVAPGAATGVGFQLSFAGAAGLVFLRPRLLRMLSAWSHRSPPAAANALVTSLSATLATAPLVAWHFGELPLLGLPMTAALTPLISAAILGAVATLALDIVLPGLAALPAGGTVLLLHGATVLTTWAGAPGWTTYGAARVVVLGATAGLIVGWITRPRAVRRPRGRQASRTGPGRPTVRGSRSLLRAAPTHAMALCVAGAVGLPAAMDWAGRGSAELTMIDVGQGDALAVRSPMGRWLLIDAGPAGGRFDAGAARVLPYLRERGVDRLEALVITHADLDHFGGAESVLSAVPVESIVDPGVPAPKEPWARLLKQASSADLRWTVVDDRTEWNLDGMVVEVWRPPDSLIAESEGSGANAASLVIGLRYGSFRALFTGDAPVVVEEEAGRRFGDVTLLKVGHHGSKTSTSEAFLEAIRPEVALISVGRRNRFGHPEPEVLRRLEGTGARILRTDRHGTVRVRFHRDGSFGVRTER